MILLTNETTKEVTLLEEELKVFKYLYAQNLFITKIADGKIETVNDKEEPVLYTFGNVTIDTKGTSKAVETAMITYRNKLREDMEEIQEIVPFTPEQLAKLAKSFSVIKEK